MTALSYLLNVLIILIKKIKIVMVSVYFILIFILIVSTLTSIIHQTLHPHLQQKDHFGHADVDPERRGQYERETKPKIKIEGNVSLQMCYSLQPRHHLSHCSKLL